MKNIDKLFFIGLFLFPLSLLAQITLTTADRPDVNTSVTFAVDTMVSNFNFGVPGPGNVLNYDSLDADVFFTNSYIAPADAPGAASFPDADVVLDAGDSFQFIDYTDDCSDVIGIAFDLDGTMTDYLPVALDPEQKIAAFPFTLDDTFTAASRLELRVDGQGSGFDSILLIQNVSVMAEADASGTITLPGGNTYDALRITQLQTVTDSLFVLFQGEYQLAQTGSETFEFISWHAKESKGILLQASVLESGDFQVVFFSELAAAPAAAFSAEDQGAGVFAFTDLSTNAPTSWSWDFGDGTTSNLQNPMHTYVSSGDYEVCLSVSNDIGTDSTCQTITAIIVSVNDPALRSQLSIFPLPAKEVLHFRWSEQTNTPMQLAIFDALGRKVQHHRMQGDLSIPVQTLPAGSYFYHILGENGDLLLSGRIPIQ